MYVITNNKLLIKQSSSGCIETTKSIDEALKFEDKKKIENFYRNIPRVYKNVGFSIKEIKEPEEENRFGDFSEYEDETCMENIQEKIKNIQNFFRSIYRQKEIAEQRIQEAEKEIFDIEHAAEFYLLNASQGYNIYKMLHESRMKRRKYKDQLLFIEYIINGQLDGLVDGNTLKRIQGMDNRQYKPRILEKLFEMERNI